MKIQTLFQNLKFPIFREKVLKIDKFSQSGGFKMLKMFFYAVLKDKVFCSHGIISI